MGFTEFSAIMLIMIGLSEFEKWPFVAVILKDEKIENKFCNIGIIDGIIFCALIFNENHLFFSGIY